MRPVAILMLSTVLVLPCGLVAQAHGNHEHADAPHDSGFRAMQARGKGVMGVDQYTSVHRFDALPDGGRIELQRDRDDSAGATTIRAHLRAIARSFAAGDFSAPSQVHGEAVPGAPVMRARRSTIRYEISDLPRGAVLRIHSADTVAIGAIHRFLAYQRREHHADSASRAH